MTNEIRTDKNELEPSKTYESPYGNYLLEPEQEEQVAKQNNVEDRVDTLTDGKSTIEILGIDHTYTLEDAQVVTDTLNNVETDILLIEGVAALNIAKTLPANTKPQDVINQYGEQTYATWLALQNGIEVKTWDFSILEVAQEIREKHEPDAIAGWLIGQGVKHLIDKKDAIDAQTLVNLVKNALEVTEDEFEQNLGIKLTAQELERVTRHYTGKSFSELTYEDGENLSTPRQRGETNNVIRDFNYYRDNKFLKVVEAEKTKEKNIAITAGKSHAITWKPALEQLYAA